MVFRIFHAGNIAPGIGAVSPAPQPNTNGLYHIIRTGKRKKYDFAAAQIRRKQQAWRRGGDSNPRWSCPHTTFPRLHHRPLGHPSSRCYVACRSERSGARSGTRTRTYSRIADFESAAAAITPPWRRDPPNGAGEGNRTLVASLEGWSSAIELRPPWQRYGDSLSHMFLDFNP